MTLSRLLLAFSGVLLLQAQSPEVARRVPPKAAAEFRKSLAALEEGKIDKAIRHLEAGLAIDPSNSDAYNDLGVIYFNTNRPDKAIEAFTQMVAADPRSFRGYLNLAYAFNLRKQYPESERAARRALEIRTAEAQAHYLLGLALSAQRRNPEEALQHFEISAAEFPDSRGEISRIRAQELQASGKSK